MGRVTARRPVTRMSASGERSRRSDTLVVEEPLEIRVNGTALTVTMRTPGDDVDLVHGFLTGEGVIAAAADVAAARFCDGAGADGRNTYNVLDVLLAGSVAPPDVSLTRNFFMSSSCGLCGKASIESVRTSSRWHIGDDDWTMSASTILGLPATLRAAQRIFESTGGLHGAALARADGELMVVREDVGRHNAVDKVIGWALRNDRLPLRQTALLVSGRASFELTQKAFMAGISMLVAVSAPSSLAVDLAAETGMTLIGFTRGDSMVAYTGEHRVSPDRG